jgi:hypothetical protein
VRERSVDGHRRHDHGLIMIHAQYHSEFGTYDYANDEKQAKLTLFLSFVMALVTVALILAAVLSTRACAV